MRVLNLILLLSLPFCTVLRAQGVAEPPVRLNEVVVTPSRFGVADLRVASPATLTDAELEVLPQLGDDLFRSIARLPGLAADDVSAQFWVRGAPHSQLLARLDGMDLLEPFHLKDVDGALSIVDPATIRQLDLTTGGFAADYGDRLAGVLTMETKSATRSLTEMNLSLSGLGASFQGVLAGGRARWMFSGRRGYPDVALKAAGRDDELYPRYYDVMAKIEYDVTPQHLFSLHALHAGDTLRYRRTNSPSLSSAYDTSYVWARWRASWTEHVRSETVVSWTGLTWSRDGSGRLDGYPFFLRDRRRMDLGALRQDWTYLAGERVVLRGGLETKAGAADYNYALAQQRTGVVGTTQVVLTNTVNTVLDREGSGLAAFAAAKVRPLGSLVLEPGVRFGRHDYSRDKEWNPRLSAAHPVGRGMVRAAWGLYSQAHGLQELSVSDGERVYQRAERAEHRVFSVEHPVGNRVSVRVEAYERVGTRLRTRWENLDNPYDIFAEAKSDRVRLKPSRGLARGVELLLSSRGDGPLQWHVSYVVSRAEERIAGRWVPRSRDQRHAFYTDATYTLNPRWQFSAAWHYHSGWPTTDVVYSLATVGNNRRLLVSTNGPMYSLQMPDYHRMDLRATRRFKLARSEVRAFIDIFNVYDRVNLLGYDHKVTVTGTVVTDVKKPREQLPFLPSIGVSWGF